MSLSTIHATSTGLALYRIPLRSGIWVYYYSNRFTTQQEQPTHETVRVSPCCLSRLIDLYKTTFPTIGKGIYRRDYALRFRFQLYTVYSCTILFVYCTYLIYAVGSAGQPDLCLLPRAHCAGLRPSETRGVFLHSSRASRNFFQVLVFIKSFFISFTADSA